MLISLCHLQLIYRYMNLTNFSQPTKYMNIESIRLTACPNNKLRNNIPASPTQPASPEVGRVVTTIY